MFILFLGMIIDIVLLTITYPLIYIPMKIMLKDEINFKKFYLDLVAHTGDKLREVLYNG